MMHIARMASLILAFYLLTSAATAYAECAWVLWMRVFEGVKISVDPLDSFRSVDECKKALVADPTKAAIAEGERRGVTIVPICLPDTLDPRGPKGGGR